MLIILEILPGIWVTVVALPGILLLDSVLPLPLPSVIVVDIGLVDPPGLTEVD